MIQYEGEETMVIQYNKLVRDRIPEIIESSGKSCSIEILSAEDYLRMLDAKLDEVSKGWKTSRMGKVDLTILRLAVYEMMYDEDIPEKVAINEAVELSKKVGGDESPAFINGVLAKLAGK